MFVTRCDPPEPSDDAADPAAVRCAPSLHREADTPFDSDADHNRNHVLVDVRSYSPVAAAGEPVCERDRPGLSDCRRGIGLSLVGQVLAVGTAVDHLSVGDRVVAAVDWPPRRVGCGMPTWHASRQRLRLHHDDLVVIPDHMPPGEALMLWPFMQQAAAISRIAHVGQHSRVLLFGADGNPVAIAVHAHLESLSATVVTTECAHGEDDGATGWEQARQAARRLGGVDVAIDPCGGRHAARAVSVLTWSGSYVLTEQPLGRLPDDRDQAEPTPRWANLSQRLMAANLSVSTIRLGRRDDLMGVLADWSAGRLALPTADLCRDFGVGTRRPTEHHLEDAQEGRVIA